MLPLVLPAKPTGLCRDNHYPEKWWYSGLGWYLPVKVEHEVREELSGQYAEQCQSRVKAGQDTPCETGLIKLAKIPPMICARPIQHIQSIES